MKKIWIVFLLLFLCWIPSFGCAIQVHLCKTGYDCKEGFRCVESQCEQPNLETAENQAPIARVSFVPRGRRGVRVRLSGSASSDVNLDALSFSWTWLTKPTGSKTKLDRFRSPNASFLPDVPGFYEVKLVVTDPFGLEDSVTQKVHVNYPPEANGGDEVLTTLNQTVVLQSKGSRDLDEDPLQFEWKLLKRPDNSVTNLAQQKGETTSFLVDKEGFYVVQLQANDGFESTLNTVLIKVVNPAEIQPSLHFLSPWKVPQKSVTLIEAHGTNFIQGAKALFDNKPVPTTYLSKEKLLVRLDLIDAFLGAHHLKVENPGGNHTKQLLVQVTEVPAPTLESVSPISVPQGEIVSVTLKGKNFVQGAKAYFNNQPIESQYIDQTQLKVTINAQKMKLGKFPIVVENEKDKRSNEVLLQVIQPPMTPKITIMTPTSITITTIKTELTLCGTGLMENSQLWIDGKILKANVQVVLKQKDTGTGCIAVKPFMTNEFSIGKHEVIVRNPYPGGYLQSNSFYLYIIEAKLTFSLSSITFYEKGTNAATYTPVINRNYDVKLYISPDWEDVFEILINGKVWNGKAKRYASRRINMENFSTQGMKAGTIQFQVRVKFRGKTYDSNPRGIRLLERIEPKITKLYSSDGTFFTDRKYSFWRIIGSNFTEKFEVTLNGEKLKGNFQRTSANEIYLYNINTSGLSNGQQILQVYNIDEKGKKGSNLYGFSLSDLKAPVLTRTYFTPSTVYQHETHTMRLYGQNFSRSMKVYIDGKEVSMPFSYYSTSQLHFQSFVVNFQEGNHTVEVSNSVQGKEYRSNPVSFVVRAWPTPEITNLSQYVFSPESNTKLTITGRNISTKATLSIGSTKFQVTGFRTYGRGGTITFDGSNIPEGSHELYVVNPDGKRSLSQRVLFSKKNPAVLFRLTPTDLYLPKSNTLSVRMTIYGSNLRSGDIVLIDGKVAGTLSSSSPTYGTANISTSNFTKSGKVSIQLRKATGVLSNPMECWVHVDDDSKVPEVVQLSPDRVSVSTATTQTITAYGRNLSEKTTVLINGFEKKITSYNPLKQAGGNGVFYSGSVQFQLRPLDYISEGKITIELKNPGEKRSKGVSIGFSGNGIPTISYFRGSYPYFWPSIPTGSIVRLRGSSFKSTMSVYLEGKKLTSTLQNSYEFYVTLPDMSAYRPGDVVFFQVRDQNSQVVSNSKSYLCYRGPIFSSFQKQFVSKSEPSPTIQFGISQNGSLPTATIAGQSFSLHSGTNTLNLGGIIKNLSEGFHTFSIDEKNGTKSPTAAFYVIP